jgi:hypothetical protein
MRARNIKPGFFKNEDLAEIGPCGQILFAGLWGLADREGKLEDRPKRIKAEIFPYYEPDPQVDALLNQLQERGFLIRYSVGGRSYIKILNFLKHQSPHHTEKKSILPNPCESPGESPEIHGEATVKSRKSNGENPSDSLNPDSLNDDSLNPENPPIPPEEGNERNVRELKVQRRKKAGKPLKMTSEMLVALWNEVNPLPGTKEITLVEQRRRRSEVRLGEHDDPEWWRTIFQKIRATPFLRGESGSFKATFDWCIKNGVNALKIFEGQYDQHKGGSNEQKADPYADVTTVLRN